ncbi:MAG: aminotransferase class V-fold PLP-dependent enzyme [Anaerolineales bacterium]|nr:aminotransferase class V-fold PLP-dependent enzyme [Anaerolineales bacterium]
MLQNHTGGIEESLDPEDWESMRTLAHRMVDDMFEYTMTLRQRPPWRHAPAETKAHFNQPLPLDPQAPEEIYQEFLEHVLPYPVGNIHPRFWGWVFGNGTPLGALAEYLAASMNIGASGDLSYHSALYVEHQVLNWLKAMMGFPASASGVLTSGCSAANLIGLAVARNTKAGFDLRSEGLGAAHSTMTLYASEQIHSSIQKAVELLGLGSQALRQAPVNDQFRIDLDSLEAAIDQDRDAGFRPFCVVGAAGTTNTGAIDDLEALADLCRAQQLWLHVDGAFGAWAVLVAEEKHLVNGMERADSLALDLHKWMYMPYEIGCVLVRDEQAHREAFSLTPAYLAHGEGERGLTGRDLPWLTDYDFQLSKQSRGLKAWMSLKEHGVDKYARLIQQNIEQARYLGGLVQAAPELELAAPVTLNVVCFRYVCPDLDAAAQDALNKRILVELQESGLAVLSGTTIRDKYVLHVAHTNHRSRKQDFDLLVREVIRLGNEGRMVASK